jgi:hypothetical protein
MSEGPKTYHLDDELNRGYPDKPILKEEQKKILERLLEVDHQRLSPDELEMMQKLIHRLDEDSQRIKDMRRKVEGKGTLDSVLAALQKDPALARYASQPVKPPEPSAPKPQERPASAPRIEKPSKSVLSAPGSNVERPKPRQEPPAELRTPRPRPWSTVQPEVRPSNRRTTPPPPQKPAQAQPAVKPVENEPEKPLPLEPPIDLKGSEVILEVAVPEKPKSDPIEVVRRYILAWNHKAFAAEYECFSPSLMKMSKQDYVDRRMAAYLSYNRGGDFTQNLETVLKTHVEGDRAEVVCLRTVREFHKLNRYTDFYTLQLEAEQWRITGVTTEMLQERGAPTGPRWKISED